MNQRCWMCSLSFLLGSTAQTVNIAMFAKRAVMRRERGWKN